MKPLNGMTLLIICRRCDGEIPSACICDPLQKSKESTSAPSELKVRIIYDDTKL